MSQRTLENKPVSEGLAKQLGRMIEDAMPNYSGGTAKAELAKGDPELIPEFFGFLDIRAAKRAELLAFTERPAWKPITIGTHKDKDSLKAAVEAAGHKFSDWANGVVKNAKFAVETTERKLDLFTCTVAELGFPDGARVDAIYAKLDSLGFGKCPDETALQLRLAYADQPMDEFRIVISEPRAGAAGFLRVLYVVRSSRGSWVFGLYAGPDYVWRGDYPLVFCRK